jgi:hypothetical protein
MSSTFITSLGQIAVFVFRDRVFLADAHFDLAPHRAPMA